MAVRYIFDERLGYDVAAIVEHSSSESLTIQLLPAPIGLKTAADLMKEEGVDYWESLETEKQEVIEDVNRLVAETCAKVEAKQEPAKEALPARAIDITLNE